MRASRSRTPRPRSKPPLPERLLGFVVPIGVGAASIAILGFILCGGEDFMGAYVGAVLGAVLGAWAAWRADRGDVLSDDAAGRWGFFFGS